MKRFSILTLGALAFLVNACERHPAAELPPEHATAFGEHAWSPETGSRHGDTHAPAAGGHGPAASPDHAKAPAPAAPATHGAAAETPAGFFPEKK